MIPNVNKKLKLHAKLFLVKVHFPRSYLKATPVNNLKLTNKETQLTKNWNRRHLVGYVLNLMGFIRSSWVRIYRKTLLKSRAYIAESN